MGELKGDVAKMTNGSHPTGPDKGYRHLGAGRLDARGHFATESVQATNVCAKGGGGMGPEWG